MNIRAVISRQIYASRSGFSHEKAVPNPECNEFEVNNWMISDFVLARLVPVVGCCPFPLNEQMLMAATVCRLKPTHIFEWGTNIGTSARIFYETCKAFAIDCEIHSTDLSDDIDHIEHPGKMRGRLVREKPGVKIHVGDGLNTSLRIAARYMSEKDFRPLFFVDGDHGYTSVKRELDAIIEQVPKPCVLLHDTFYQSAGSGYNIGPHQAIIDTLKDKANLFKVTSQNLGLPGMTLLWPLKR